MAKARLRIEIDVFINVDDVIGALCLAFEGARQGPRVALGGREIGRADVFEFLYTSQSQRDGSGTVTFVHREEAREAEAKLR